MGSISQDSCAVVTIDVEGIPPLLVNTSVLSRALRSYEKD